jgi:glutathione S-transferase
MRVYRIPYSTNVERVALALAHKSIPVDWVDVDPDDRSAVIEISGQDLVPVMVTDYGEVVADSMRIVSWLEKRRPDPPLWPASLGRRAEVDVFIEWFNKVWKVPPNAMAAELAAPAPDQRRLHDLSDELRGWLHLFEEMLDGRDWLMGETFGAADVCAFPFMKYGVLDLRDDDTDRFHRVLNEHLPISGAFPEIEAWVHRVDALPRA